MAYIKKMRQCVSVPSEPSPAFSALTGSYEEWLQLGCQDMVPAEDIVAGGSEIGAVLDRFRTKVAYITYFEPYYHVALLVYQPRAGLQYVDCMANPRSEQQKAMECELRRFAENADIPFVGSEELYGYNDSKDEYNKEPPQAAEQQFIGLYHHYPEWFTSEVSKLEPQVRAQIVQYAERYNMHSGKDCKFWAHHIAYAMISKGISAQEWFEDQTWWTVPNGMQRGALITQYIARAVAEDILRCRKQRLSGA